MRLILGASSIWVLMLVARKAPQLRGAIRSREGISNVAIGAFFGPFLGITLSMVAVTYSNRHCADVDVSYARSHYSNHLDTIWTANQLARDTGGGSCCDWRRHVVPELNLSLKQNLRVARIILGAAHKPTLSLNWLINWSIFGVSFWVSLQ